MVLYLKESPQGKKYLGKTTKDPFKYKGSGIVWKQHLKKYNILAAHLTTTILFESEDKEEFKQVAKYYSKKWDIVNNPEFCNLTEEEGQGGDTSKLIDYSKRNTHNPNPKGNKGHSKETVSYFKEDTTIRIYTSQIGDYESQGWKKGMSPLSKQNHKGRVGDPWNKGKKGYTVNNRSKGIHKNSRPQERVICTYCNKEGGISNMTRHHFENCKNK
jgi:hypothetical protein